MKRPFTLNDFRKQLDRIARPNLIERMIRLMPGMGELAKTLKKDHLDHKRAIGRLSGMVDSMTPEERVNAKLIDKSRRRRIAKGAGVPPREVNDLLNQYNVIVSMIDEGDDRIGFFFRR